MKHEDMSESQKKEFDAALHEAHEDINKVFDDMNKVFDDMGKAMDKVFAVSKTLHDTDVYTKTSWLDGFKWFRHYYKSESK